ncbi:GNAT family N-acetyltransferase [Microvirga sp. 2TAF3]|uniref:GNAT family N-acetyltransferase n=1 Tax=Microvirga sp. 2TAF3 TaxID=3233014 RepID=UPI003F9D902D
MDPQPQHPPDIESLVIRAVRLGDAEEIAAIACLPGYRWGTLSLPHRTSEDIRKRLESQGPGDVSLVASLDGRIVANGGLTRFPGRRAHVGLLGMGVHDDYQGRGIGSRLLREILSVADDWLGLKRIELTVYTDNAPAIALYKRHGFEIEGTHRGFAFRQGAFVDAHAMARLNG